MITLSEDDWVDQYKPIPDPKNRGMGYDFGNGSCLVELSDTHQYCVHRVWTVVECDGVITIDSDITCVNRLGYIITKEPWPPNEFIQVTLDSVEEPEE